MSFYQYEPPVAMFSMAEVDKYNNYQNGGYVAMFAGEANPFPAGPGWRAKEAVKKGVQMTGAAAGMGLGYVAQGIKGIGSGVNKVGTMAAMNPKLAGAALIGSGLAAGGGAMFLRRRRSKKGKMIVEQVRR